MKIGLDMCVVPVRGWTITRRRFRPTFKDRLTRVLSVIPGLVGGPRQSFREQHVAIYPHLLSVAAVLAPGVYSVRQVVSSGQPMSEVGTTMLRQRFWRSDDPQQEGTALHTDLNDSELELWRTLTLEEFTLILRAVPFASGVGVGV